MNKRLLLLAATAPLLAQAGCTQQDMVGLVMVMVQSLLTSVVPMLVSALMGGTTTGLGL
jgi:hypothetical protein